MKDLPHHIKQLNRKVIRSVHREEMADSYDMPDIPPRELSEKQKKKQAKINLKKERDARPSSQLTPDERNKKMRKRVPPLDRRAVDRRQAGVKATQKKTPRI